MDQVNNINNHSSDTGGDSMASILSYIEIIYRHRIMIISIITIISLVRLIGLVRTPNMYTAETTILPNTQGTNGSDITALKGLFGLSRMNNTSMINLYPDILKSRRIVDRILLQEFYSDQSDGIKMLLDIIVPQDLNIEERMQIGREILSTGVINIQLHPVKFITTIAITTTDPHLSASIARAFVEELDSFLRERTISKAGENRLFVEERIEETDSLLRSSEEVLKKFRENNKRIENSPQLLLEQGRLVREVKVQEEVYLTLKREYETIKIEEVKNLPVLGVLDFAIAPIKKSGPYRTRSLILTFFAAAGISLVLSFGHEFVNRMNREHKTSRSYNRLKIEVLRDLEKLKEIYGNVILRGRGNK